LTSRPFWASASSLRGSRNWPWQRSSCGGPRDWNLALVVAINVTLIAIYAYAVLVGLPFAGTSEHGAAVGLVVGAGEPIDILGAVSKVGELLSLAIAFRLLGRWSRCGQHLACSTADRRVVPMSRESRRRFARPSSLNTARLSETSLTKFDKDSAPSRP